MFQANDFFRNAQTIIVTVAILVWGWMYFFHDKVFADEEMPSAEIGHDIFSTCLNSNGRLVRLRVEVHNIGNVQIELPVNHHSIAQVSPFPEGEKFDAAVRDVGTTGSEPELIVWPELLKNPTYSTGVTVQPGEIHEQYHDFVITPSARVIELTSTFTVAPQSANVRIDPLQAQTIYDLGDATCP